ncbi:WbqC family protein [Dechloromonas sp.]|uniref:WbqC family protein n=1 Tax=Dechloromonas sp. TaxID=1917218 RepID=UPI00286DB741|nr:WbqC family protein [Dechloromonas sp.]
MKIGVIQSSYIPWRGYFDFIASVDAFVFHDDIQYTKSDWRNRNRIKTPKGTEWLTVPVHYKEVSQLICETSIDHSTLWQQKHLRRMQENYREAPYAKAAWDILAGVQFDRSATISNLNIELTKQICDYLCITTPLIASSELSLVGTKTDRLIDLLKKLNATTYLSGPSADGYLDRDAFRKNKIRLEYKSYDYDPYPQLWGPFEGAVTVLDLIANCGPDAKGHIRSRTPDKVIIERSST